MAGLGHVVPLSQQGAESFHGLRRTQEGLLYYTKVDKDGADIIDPEGGVPTDKNGGKQLPTKQDYTEEDFDFQSTIQYFAGDGSATTFTLSFTPPNENYLQVYWDGVYQNHSEYTVSGTTLDFGSGNAPANGTSIEVVIPTINGIGTPSDGTVTPAKLSTGGPSWDTSSNFIVGSSYVRSDSTSMSTTSATTVASHAIATYRSVKYQIQVTRGAAYETREISVIHDGTTAYMTEYAHVFTSTGLGTFDATISSGNLLLQFTPGSSTSTTVKVISSAISV